METIIRRLKEIGFLPIAKGVVAGFFGFIVIVMLSSFIMRTVVKPPVEADLDEEVERYTIHEVIQLNVLNACGKSGLAATTKEYLNARGFDVLEIGNASETKEQTKVIDRVGDLKSARKVAYAMGINDSLIVSQIDSSMFVRTSVVIGNDFSELNPFN